MLSRDADLQGTYSWLRTFCTDTLHITDALRFKALHPNQPSPPPPKKKGEKKKENACADVMSEVPSKIFEGGGGIICRDRAIKYKLQSMNRKI